MRARLLALSLAVAAVAVAAACDDDPAGPAAPGTSSGGTSATTSSGGTGPVRPTAANVADFCDRTLGVVVDVLERCCSAADKETLDYKLTRDLAAFLKPQCTIVLVGSSGAGRVLYRAERAEACYAAYAGTYGGDRCANVTETFADPSGTACREAFVGTGPSGAKCRGDHECVDGLTCVGYTESVDGLCSAPPALGQPCGKAKGDSGSVSNESVLSFGTHPQCATGAACDGASGTCVTAKAAKIPAAEGAACEAKEDCASDLTCDDTRKCAQRKPAGAACTGVLLSTECAGRCDAKTGQPGSCAKLCGSR